MEDALKDEDYKRMACQLKESVMRRNEYISALKACPRGGNSVENLRFMKCMHLEDLEKGTRLLLMMKETVKLHWLDHNFEYVLSFVVNLEACMYAALYRVRNRLEAKLGELMTKSRNPDASKNNLVVMSHLLSLKFSNLGKAEVEKDDRERAHFRDGKISSGRKKSWGTNIGDSDNTEGDGKIVGGAI
nr:hypothetical protein [Tanacetum cinerariifolium]